MRITLYCGDTFLGYCVLLGGLLYTTRSMTRELGAEVTKEIEDAISNGKEGVTVYNPIEMKHERFTWFDASNKWMPERPKELLNRLGEGIFK